MTINGDDPNDQNESGISEVEKERRTMLKQLKTNPSASASGTTAAQVSRGTTTVRDSDNFNPWQPAEVPATIVTVSQPVVPKTFKGTAAEDVIEWLEDFKRASSANQWDTDKKKLARVPYALEGTALKWYKSSVEPLLQTQPLYDFNDFVNSIESAFKPTSPKLMYLSRFQDRKQREGETIKSTTLTKLS